MRKRDPRSSGAFREVKGQGLVIIGAYGSSEDSSVKALRDSAGIEYPLMPSISEMDVYRTDYVPTTVFFSGGGELLSEKPYIGSMSYSEWENLILSYLGE